jgi:hypothetical protein
MPERNPGRRGAVKPLRAEPDIPSGVVTASPIRAVNVTLMLIRNLSGLTRKAEKPPDSGRPDSS